MEENESMYVQHQHMSHEIAGWMRQWHDRSKERTLKSLGERQNVREKFSEWIYRCQVRMLEIRIMDLSLHWTARMSLVRLMPVDWARFGFRNFLTHSQVSKHYKIIFWREGGLWAEKIKWFTRVRGDRKSFVLGLVWNVKLRGFG